MNQKPLSVEMVNPAILESNPWNTNSCSPDNEAKLEASITRFGMFKPVVVRETESGSLQIIGGEHRAIAAKRLGMKTIPVVNLGRIDDKKAKEVGLIDNSRYGNDDTLQLAALLEGLGTVEELSSFMPYGEADLASIFSSISIELDDLDIPDNDESPRLPAERPIQTHVVMRFRIPVEDTGWISEMIEKTMEVHKFAESDSLTNAGDALVHILNGVKRG